MPSPAACIRDLARSRSPSWRRAAHAALLLTALLAEAGAAVQDIYPTALMTSGGYCPWAQRDNLQNLINTNGSTGVLLDPSVDYSTLTNGHAQNLVIGANTQLYGMNTLIGSFTIAQGAHDIYMSGLKSGLITFQAGAQISRVIFNRMSYFTLSGVGCRVDELTWFDAYNCDIAFDCSLGGYVRNFRVIRDANQDNTQPFALKGNAAEPSYGNNIVVGNYLNGMSPQGPRVSMVNVGDWLTIQIGAESYNAPQFPWFSPINVPNVRCIGTGGLVDYDHVWETNSPSVLLVGDQMTTYTRETATTSTTDHHFLPGVLSKVSIDVPYPPQQWNATTTYQQYTQAYFGPTGKYSSTTAGNLNNTPSPTSPFWSPQQYLGYDDEDDNTLSQVTRATLFDNQVTIAKTISFNGVNAPATLAPAAIQSIRATAAAPNSGLLPWNPPTYAAPPTTFPGLPSQGLTAAEIQSQLDDVTGSGVVMLAAGVYTISQPLLLGVRPDGKRRILIGAGKSQTVLQAFSSAIDLIRDAHDANGLSSIDVVDLTLSGGNWGINLFSVMSGGDWAQLQYTDSLLSSVCILNMASGGVQLQNLYGMDNNAFQDVDFVNCPIGWQQLGGINDPSGLNWTYMDKNMWLGCQFINCGTALNLVQGDRPSGANVFMETLFSGCTTAILTNGAHSPLYWINCDLVNNAGNPMIYDFGECNFISTRVSAAPASGVTQSVYDGFIGIFEGCLFTQTGSGSCTVIRTLNPSISIAQNAAQAAYDGRCTHFLNCTSTMPVGQWYNGSSINCNFSSSADHTLGLSGALVYAYSDTSTVVGLTAPLPPSALSYTVLDPSVPSPQPAVLLCAHQYSNPLVPIPAGIPSITSATTVAMTYNAAGTFQVSASNGATSFSAQGLPPGLSISPGSGLISGTPTAAGSWLVPLFAGNAAGSSGGLLTITVTGQGSGAPAFGAIPSPITGTTNVALLQSVAATGATSYAAQGLPPGLSINAATGQVSGTPTIAGTTASIILAANASGTAVQQVSFTIAAGTPAFSPSLGAITGYVGRPLSINAAAAGATAYTATGLPSGLVINASSGLISGTPTVAGSFPVSVQATGNGTATANFTLTIIALTLPQFAAVPNPITAVVGTAFSISLPASDDSADAGLSTIWYQVNSLPAGLALQVNGSITGTPTAAGTSSTELQATGLAGTTQVTLNWSISNPAGGGPGGSASADGVSGGGGSAGCGLGAASALLSLLSLLGLISLIGRRRAPPAR